MPSLFQKLRRSTGGRRDKAQPQHAQQQQQQHPQQSQTSSQLRLHGRSHAHGHGHPNSRIHQDKKGSAGSASTDTSNDATVIIEPQHVQCTPNSSIADVDGDTDDDHSYPLHPATPVGGTQHGMNGNASSSSNANSRRITMSPTMQEQSPSRRIDFDAIPENARQAATTTTTTTTTRQKKSRQSLKQQHLQQQQYRNRHSSSPLPVSPSPSKNTVGPLSMPQSPSPSHGATPTKNDVQQHRASNPNNATNSVSTPHSSSTTSSSAKKSFLFRSTKQRSSSPAVAASQSTQQQQQQQDKRRRSSSKPKRRSKSKGRLANNSVSESSVSRSEEASTAHDAESIASSTMSMSATLVPTKDGTFVSSATMKRRQRLAASSNSLKNHNNNNSNSNNNKASSKKKTFSIGASKAVSSSLQAARGMMAFRKAKSTKAVGGKGNHADDDDDDDDDVATDLLCRTVRVAPADSDPTAMQHPENPIAKQNMTPAQLRAQRRETERIARAAAALDNKGNQLFEKGYYDKAMEIYTKALRLKRRTFHTLLDEADDILDEALEGENLARNPEKADAKLLVSMATSINNIGYLRQRSGEATHDETMAAYRKSLRIKREILGMDSLSVGKTLNNIGSVHYLKREFPDALVAYTEALRIMQSNLGDFDKDVATVWSNMGDVYWAMGKQKEQALEHYRTALTIRWERFGEHDPRVVRLLEKIAAIEIGDKMLAQSELQNATNANARHMIDEDDLFDLDNRPVVQELHMLHNEVEKDMMYVDLMQKRMKVDMVKDKVNIMRGMRLLEETSKQQMDAMNREKTTIPTPKSPTAPTNRETALQNIKNRLAKLRENRETQTEQQTENHKKYSTLCGTSLYKATTTTIQRPTLSSYEPNELKQELDSIRSAFVLKQGIESLRSFAV